MLRLALLSILATVAFSQVPCGTYVRVLLAGGSCGAVTVHVTLSPSPGIVQSLRHSGQLTTLGYDAKLSV